MTEPDEAAVDPIRGEARAELDPTPYIAPLQIDAASGVALAIALLHAAPAELPQPVKKAALALRAATVALQEAWAARDRAASELRPTDAKVADQLVDAAWAALRQRLEGYAALPFARHPGARRAAEIASTLFPEGLCFLMLPYLKEWAHSAKILRLVDEERLAPEIDAFAGPEFLAEVRRAHEAYGAALGIDASGATALAPVTVVEPLRALGRAIGSYALKMLALADAEDETSITLVRAALSPIENFRELRARSAATGSSMPPPRNVSPDTPVPEVR